MASGSRKRNARIKSVIVYTGALLVLAYLIGPFLWLLTSSFQTETALLSVPPSWIPNPVDASSYVELLTGAFKDDASGVPYQSRVFLPSLVNSFIVALSVSALSVAIGSYA